MWQRGLSLYYVGRYAEGATQFRDDVAVNPNDTEESIWALLCEARTLPGGFAAAQAAMLRVGRDGRPVMRAAYELFQGAPGASIEALQEAARASPHDTFYSLLYQVRLTDESDAWVQALSIFCTRAFTTRHAGTTRLRRRRCWRPRAARTAPAAGTTWRRWRACMRCVAAGSRRDVQYACDI